MTVFQRSAPYIIPRPDREWHARHHKVFEKLPVTELAERVHLVRRDGVAEHRLGLLAAAQACARGLVPAAHAQADQGQARLVREGLAGLSDRLQADPLLRQLPALRWRAQRRPGRPRRSARSQPTVSSPPTASNTAPTSSSGAPGSRCRSSWRRWRSRAQADATCMTSGARARAPTTAWPSRTSPTCWSCTDPTRTPAAARSSTSSRRRRGYLGDFVDRLAKTGKPLAVRAEVEQAYDDQIQQELSGSVWSQCTSWYRTANGRITANWPWLGHPVPKAGEVRPSRL